MDRTTRLYVYLGAGIAALAWLSIRSKAQAAQGSQQLTSSGLPIQAGAQMLPELPGALAATGSALAHATDLWSTLAPVAPIDSGFINFPSGTQVAAALMSAGNTRMDGNGNYYVQWAGQVYQLGSQDSAGNWPALLANVS